MVEIEKKLLKNKFKEKKHQVLLVLRISRNVSSYSLQHGGNSIILLNNVHKASAKGFNLGQDVHTFQSVLLINDYPLNKNHGTWKWLFQIKNEPLFFFNFPAVKDRQTEEEQGIGVSKIFLT